MNSLPTDATFGGLPSLETYASNLKEKLEVCNLLLQSGFCPASFKTPGAVLGCILYGQELKFSPMQALNSIDMIQGKPTVNAQGLKAMIIQHGGLIRQVEWTDKSCTLEGVRGQEKEIVTYNLDDARLAGLAGKDNWKRMPKAMLYARCVSIIARNQWADVIKGLYSAEEMRDSIVYTDRPNPYNAEPLKTVECSVKVEPESKMTKKQKLTIEAMEANKAFTYDLHAIGNNCKSDEEKAAVWKIAVRDFGAVAKDKLAFCFQAIEEWYPHLVEGPEPSKDDFDNDSLPESFNQKEA